MLFLFGCAVNKSARRPFIITEKIYIYSEKDMAEYRFVDSTGKVFMFYDDIRYFEIGDTIKNIK